MKKPAGRKRTEPPRACDYTRAFLKDWQRLSRSGRYNMNRLKAVMMQLIEGRTPLPPELKEYPLSGDMQGLRECHVGLTLIALPSGESQRDGDGGVRQDGNPRRSVRIAPPLYPETKLGGNGCDRLNLSHELEPGR
ncbi:type II toxin-antitoxin system YafQ family toxin [Methylomarinovum caldicuralii]|uniref:type II toxin-antitoxin system RelE/ParE family toxin n=1 Tax=Methylomarinovum caldicuralii TaxID=438856 RepID=UPI003BF5B990